MLRFAACHMGRFDNGAVRKIPCLGHASARRGDRASGVVVSRCVVFALRCVALRSMVQLLAILSESGKLACALDISSTRLLGIRVSRRSGSSGARLRQTKVEVIRQSFGLTFPFRRVHRSPHLFCGTGESVTSDIWQAPGIFKSHFGGVKNSVANLPQESIP